MKKILSSKAKYVVLGLASVLVVMSLVLIGSVRTNYDMTLYLPDDSNTVMGLEVLENNFGNHAVVELMIRDVSVEEAVSYKALLETAEGVMQVIWLDNYVDTSIPLEFYDASIVMPFYNEGHALFTVVFFDDEYSLTVEATLNDFSEMLEDASFHLRGQAVNHRESRRVAEGEILKLILIIVPICIVVLLIASKSYIEPFILLISLGVAVALNMGTNAFLPHVSYITLTLAAALQLAVSLDYSLFLTHRYYEERDKGLDAIDATVSAMKHAFPSITASALTTIVGFMALSLMHYAIGTDIGFVLSKGIVFSYVAVFTILPVLLVVSTPLLDRLKHRNFLPSFAQFGAIFSKGKGLYIGVFVLLSITGFIIQREASFAYGNRPRGNEDEPIQQDLQSMRETFGYFQPVVVLVENDGIAKEIAIVTALSALDDVSYVESLVTVVDPSTPREELPEELVAQFIGPTHTRFIVYTTLEEENEAMYAFDENMRAAIESVHDEAYFILGFAAGTSDIREIVSRDAVIVSLVSVLAIAAILFLVFRNPIVPILLIAVIQTAIWINVSIIALEGMRPVYIGYLVVFALQLGATIDYAVLLTGRYREFRSTHAPIEAMKQALGKAAIPVMISAIVLSSAGFAVVVLFANLAEVMEIGLLIGRGALISLVSVLLFLPPMLLVFDDPIKKTTWAFPWPKSRHKTP